MTSNLRKRTLTRPSFRPQLLHLEDRTLPSTFTVVNLHDAGPGSLRAALAQAGAGDAVAFAPGLRGTITLTSGELQVGPGVTVQGPGADCLAVSANHASRVLEVLPGDGVTLSGLTITGGLASVPVLGDTAGYGGGVYVDQGACLTLSDSAVTGNTASITTRAGCGGGIYNLGTLTLEGDTVANNTANAGPGVSEPGSEGGGIYNTGTLTVEGGTVANNIADAGSGGGSGYGGGINSPVGSVSLLGVTLAGNTANSGTAIVGSGADEFGSGGGIDAEFATVTVTDCVFSGDVANSGSAITTDPSPGGGNAYATGYGGAIHAAGPLTVTDSVFLGNIGNAGSAYASVHVSVFGDGGAIHYVGPNLTITGCAFRDNIANTGPGTDSAGRAEVDGTGGAISNRGILTVGSSLFNGNVANAAGSSGKIEASGGAIDNYSVGSVTGSTLANNTANAGDCTGEIDAFGGAFENGLSGSVTTSTLANNTANAGSTPGVIQAFGGGLDNFTRGDPLALTSSSLVANIANRGSARALHAGGGGAWLEDGTVQGCLVADNIVNCGSDIGAVYLSGGGFAVKGMITVQGTLFTGNNVNTDAGSGQAAADSYAVGGGIAVEDGAALTLNGSVVIGNQSVAAPSAIALLGSGQVDPASANNLIGAGGSGGFVTGVNGNVVLGS
jgi:hypothetical protein